MADFLGQEDILALFGDDPAAAQMQARALADAMQRRRAAGTIATVIGGPFAKAGQAFLGEAGQSQNDLMHVGQYRANRDLAREKMTTYAPDNEALAADRAARLELQRQNLALQKERLLKPPTPKEPKPIDLSKSADDLRKEFQGQQGYKDFQQVSTAFEKIKSTSDTGAGDMSLIFGYMKLLDPNSTVREGEYATAANAGSVPQTLLATYNKVVTGEKLAPDVRKQFRDEATKVYNAQKAQYDRVAGPYADLAKKRGLNPADVIFGYSPPGQVQPEPAQPSAPPSPVTAAGPVQIKTKAERDALPAGTQYIGPDGKPYTKR